MSKEDWVAQWVKSIPEARQAREGLELDKGESHEMKPSWSANQFPMVDGLSNNINAEEKVVGGRELIPHLENTWDMKELAERAELLSSQIKAGLLKEEELEKRVREKRVKMKDKRDSVIMLNNVLKIKKEEVAELRRRVAGRVSHPPEPCHREGSTCQQPAGEGSYPVSVGSTEGERWNWRKDIFEEFNRNARMNPSKGERDQICVEMRRGAVSINEASSAEEVDQGSRDWMRRRLLKRENTWDSKRASTIGCRSFPFKRTLSVPSVEKLDPELVVMDNNAVTTGSSNPLK